MAQVLGSLQNIEIDVLGGTSYKNLVCLRTSSVNTTMDATTEQTNCGVLTSPSEPQMSLDFDAICETAPSTAQISYEEMLAALNGKTLVSVKISSPSAGAAYYHQFSAYVTSLSLSQEAGAYISFTGTLTSDGAMDIIA
jgi:hypothetical protein